MKAGERNDKIKKMFEEDTELMLKKGHDYSGDGDCMSNLRDFGFLGAVVRIGDKFHRLKNFAKKGVLKVSDESVLDTLRDLRNYGFLAQLLYEEELEVQNEPMRCCVCGKATETPDGRYYTTRFFGVAPFCYVCFDNLEDKDEC